MTLADHFVTATWADGTSLACYSLWLVENTVGVEPRSRESSIDPADLPSPACISEAAVDHDGALLLTWNPAAGIGDRHRSSRVHPGWLRHIAEAQHEPAALLPEVRAWTAADFDEPPTVSCQGEPDDEDLAEWLGLLCGWGVARLRCGVAEPELLDRLGPRVGPLRGSNFGATWDVRSVPNPDSTANTDLNLGQHTDLPTRETPPGFQFLHCVENTVDGGWSRMTDGHAVVSRLRRHHPDDFAALSTLHWTFFNRSTFADHRWTGPIIDDLGPRYPLTLRAFYPVRGFPAMAPVDQPRAYRAMRTFSQVAHDPTLRIRFPFEPGDVIAFDNRRILHGRDSFDAASGSRWLRGCYIDQDDVFSTVRVLARQQRP